MRRHVAKDSAALVVGTVVSGALAYVFFAAATRVLGPQEAAPISVLWTYWAASAAVLTFPVQHWIIRQLHGTGSSGGVARDLPRVYGVTLAIAVAAALVSWVLRDPLFGRDGVGFPLMVAGVTVGSGFLGVVRGGLAGRNRFAATAAVLVAENAVRVAGAVAAAAFGWGADAFGVALVAGAGAGLWWAGATRFASDPTDDRPASSIGFLGDIAGGSLLAQFVLTGGPVVLALVGGGPGEVTALFAALALFRAPYVLALGLLTQLTGALTALIAGGRTDTMKTVNAWIVGGSVLAVVAALGIALLIGPAALRLIFGPGVALPRSTLAAVAAGTALGLGALVLTLLLLARGLSRAALRIWVVAVGANLGWAVFGRGSHLHRVAVGFVLAEAVAVVGMVLIDRAALRAGAAAPPPDPDVSVTGDDPVSFA